MTETVIMVKLADVKPTVWKEIINAEAAAVAATMQVKPKKDFPFDGSSTLAYAFSLSVSLNWSVTLFTDLAKFLKKLAKIQVFCELTSLVLCTRV